MSTSLYHIDRELLEISAYLQEEELTPEIEKALELTQENRAKKLVGYAHVLEKIDSEIDLSKKRQAQEAAYQKRLLRLADALKSRAVNSVLLLGPVEAGPYVISTRKSEALVRPEDEAITPKKYIRTVSKKIIDTTAIKAALKAGRKVRGYSLEKRENLSIR